MNPKKRPAWDSEDDDDEIEEENGHGREDAEEEDRFAHETPDETRLRLAERYVRKLEALATKDDDEEDEEDIGARVAKRLKRDVREASGRCRRRLASMVAAHNASKEGGATRLVRGHQRAPTCVALADDEKTAYTGSKDATIIQYDIETGKRLWRGGRAPRQEPEEGSGRKKRKKKKGKGAPKGDKTKGHVGDVLAVSVSSDGRLLASGGEDRFVRLWDTRTHTQVHTFAGHRKAVTVHFPQTYLFGNQLASTDGCCWQGLVFRQGGQELYSASADATVKVWNVDQMSYVETLFGHQTPIMSIDCLTQERPLTAGGFDRTVRVFKVVEETHLMWKGHTAPIDGAAYLTDQLFVTGSQDGSISIWDLGLKKPRSTLPNAHGGRWVTAVAACRQSDLFATGSSDGVVRFWGVPPSGAGKLEQVGTAAVEGFVNGLSIAPSGRFAVAAIGVEPRLGRWDHIPSSRNQLAILPLLQTEDPLV